MLTAHSKGRIIAVGLLILVSLQACRIRTGRPPQNSIEGVVSTTTEEAANPIPTPTRMLETATPVPTATQLAPLPTSTAGVTITAINGNLFIRRGPDMAYNPIGVLRENSVADVIGRDVLSKWVHIPIPDSENSGWLSLQTQYSRVEGDLQTVPELTPSDWPVPAYLRNCTYHQMIVKPGDIIIPSLLGYPENEVWIYPGSYTVHDLDHPDTPEVESVEIREGFSIDIRLDGNGDKRKCP